MRLIFTSALLISIVFGATNKKPNEAFVDFPIDPDTKKITYTKVVELSNATKDMIYQASKQWFVASFGDAKSVIQVDDKDSGRIVGKGFITARGINTIAEGMGSIYFILTIDVKDGKYRYTFNDFNHKGTVHSQYTISDFGVLEQEKITDFFGMNWPTIRKNLFKDMESTTNSIETAIKKGAKKDNW